MRQTLVRTNASGRKDKAEPRLPAILLVALSTQHHLITCASGFCDDRAHCSNDRAHCMVQRQKMLAAQASTSLDGRGSLQGIRNTSRVFVSLGLLTVIVERC